MIQDKGSRQNIGFGLPLIQGEPNEDSVESGVSAESGAIAKYLGDKPVLKFAAIAAASMVSLHVAGKVASHGGVHLGQLAHEVARGGGKYAGQAEAGLLKTRKLQQFFDELEGVSRKVVDPNDLTIFAKRDPESGRWIKDQVTRTDSRAYRMVERDAGRDIPEWQFRDELQQRLVRQARRLPYEMPVFYFADKAIIDPLTGDNKERKVNWANPVDVLGDFAWETVKNTTVNILPFELGMAGGNQTVKKFAKAMSAPGGGQGHSQGVLTTQAILEQLGVKAGDVVNSTVKFSSQSLGAFSNAVEAMSKERRGIKELTKAANVVAPTKPGAASGSFAKRNFDRFKNLFGDTGFRNQALDSMPGPFKGMRTGITKFKETFSETGKTHDDWQDVLWGHKTLKQLDADGADPFRGQRVRDFMQKGGGTHIEQVADQMQKLGIRSIHSSEDVASGVNGPGGSLYNTVREQQYKDTLVQKLVGVGLDEDSAVRFVSHSSVIAAPQAKAENTGAILASRFQLGKKVSQTTDESTWWKELQDHSAGFRIGLDKIGLDDFQRAVNLADQTFSSKGQQIILKAKFESYLNHVTEKMIPEHVGQTIAARRVDYFDLKNSLGANENYLVRNTAKAMGIRPVDAAGNPHSLGVLKDYIKERGIDADDKTRLLGYLVDKKVVKAGGGKNLLGFSSLSIKEAQDSGYFAGHAPGVQAQINKIVEGRAKAHTGLERPGYDVLDQALSSLKMPGVYRSASGRVIDVGRIRRGFAKTLDTLATETKIPILNFNPASLAFHGSRQSARQAAPIQFAGKYSLQNVAQRKVGLGGLDDPDLFMYIRNPGKSKGKLFGLKGSIFSHEAKSQQYAGEYRPFLANRLAMTGRYSELYLGQSSSPEPQEGWRKIFNVATRQENQLVGGKESTINRLYAALRKRPESYRNPRRLAKGIADHSIGPDDIRTSAILSEGMDAMIGQLKGYGFSERPLQQFIRKGLIDYASPVSLLQASDSTMPQGIRQLLTNDLEEPLSDAGRAALARSQGPLKRLLAQFDNQTDFGALPAPQNIKTVGVSRRIDQLRSELSEYLVLRSDQIGSGNMDFGQRVSRMLSEVDEMFTQGKISKLERSETRTAILSLQLQHSKNKVFDSVKGQWRPELNAAVLEDTMASVKGKGLFGEYGKYSTEVEGKTGGLWQAAKSRFAPAEYQGPTEINAIGSAYTFVPTMATGFSASPLKTAKGILGGSWSDPDAITTGSLFSTHMAARVNGYFETIGLGLDLSRYKSPLDFYLRGVIGKRVLPAYVAGTMALEVDRTIGGFANKKDEEGNRVYSPFFAGIAAKGIAESQIATAGLIPGGQTAAQKREELYEGEVPVRSGRYWLLNSNTAFKGGRIQYFRPSWYQRLKAGGEYTPEMNQTPMERLAFGYDFSPLRPLDPYRFERQNAESRPYPVSGQYFTGPFGPLNSALNATVGRVIKPTVRMHEQETAAALASYTPVGQGGAISINAVSFNQSNINAGYAAAGIGTSSTTPFYGANNYTNPRGIASATTIGTANSVSTMYQNASQGGGYSGVYAPLVAQGTGMVNRYGGNVVPAEAVVRASQNKQRAGRFGFETQEMAGIYGFGFGATRQALGIGSQDYTPSAPVLQSADKGYSTSRSFWGLNLGGMGDVPMGAMGGRMANLEVSEVLRRFIPREQQGINYVNGIPNLIGQQYPWLPGPGSMNNLTQGDPYGQLPDATIRLPGTGRNRTTQRFPDQPGQMYGMVDIHDILGDLDPYGDNYRALDRQIDSMNLSPLQQAKIRQTRAQVEAVGMANEFTPYKYQDKSIPEMAQLAAQHPIKFGVNKLFEQIAHYDSFANSKFLRTRTALEDWERDNVYGATYPDWLSPKNSFIDPMVQRSTQRDWWHGASSMSIVGAMFGSTTRAKAMGGVVGGATGLAASAYGSAYEAITGRRFIPKTRKKELALEEQVDILSYMHSMTNANRAYEAGDSAAAQYFLRESSQTMYGANLNATPEQLAQAVPKRKREHFEAMMYAPEREREQILSTAGRLERRLLQAAWGQKVEKLPDLQEYFQGRELPDPESSFWSPYTDMDTIKIKMGQHMGLDMAQMGYYPQQLQEANLINPAYPQVFSKESGRSVSSKLMRLLSSMGVPGTVSQQPTPFSNGDSFQLRAGT